MIILARIQEQTPIISLHNTVFYNCDEMYLLHGTDTIFKHNSN